MAARRSIVATRRAGARPRVLAPGLLLVLAACGIAAPRVGPDAGARDAAAPDAAPPSVFDGLDEPAAAERPWVRWWWPGGDVADDELGREVGLLATAGFGGAEIQPLTIGLDPNAPADELARRTSFDTGVYYAHLGGVLAAASAAGLGVDLTLGSGSTTGDDLVPPAGSVQTLLFSETLVTGPATVRIDSFAPEQPAFDSFFGLLGAPPLARFLPDQATLLGVLAAEVTGGSRSGDLFDVTDTLELAGGSVVDLTPTLDAGGGLSWTAPAGTFAVIAVFRAPDGELIAGNADAATAWAVDPLNSSMIEAVADHLLGARTGTGPFRGRPLRGVFTDGFELKAERLTTEGVLADFKARRGYDPTLLLPSVLVPGGDDFFAADLAVARAPAYRLGPDDDRVRHDHALTLSDLFIERQLGAVAAAAHGRGLVYRAQPYGLDLDVIRAAGAVDVPETEQLYAGGSALFLKLTTSGAHLYDRPLASAEAFGWIERDHMTTPLKVRLGADTLFAAGVNHLVYRGFAYRVADLAYGLTGWTPFSSPFLGTAFTASDSFNESWPYLPFLPTLNRYLARCQQLLRLGRPEADVLVYYPWLGLPASFYLAAGHDEGLFNGFLPDAEPAIDLGATPLVQIVQSVFPVSGPAAPPDPRVTWLEGVWPLVEALAGAGHGWEWVNDDSLAEALVVDGRIVVRGHPYRALVIVDAPTMEPGAARAVAALAQGGAAVLVAGSPPAAQPGYGDRAAGDAAVAAAMAAAAAGPRTTSGGAADAAAKLAAVGVAPAVAFVPGPSPIRQTRRRLDPVSLVTFLANPTAVAQPTGVEVDGGCPGARWLDAWDGTVAPAVESAPGVLALELAPYSSAFLLCGTGDFDPARVALPAPPAAAAGDAATLGPFTLSVTGDDVPGGDLELRPATLTDWRTIPGLEHAMSHGFYAATVQVPRPEAGRYVLTAGWVYGAALVRVNDVEVGALLVPPFSVDVTAQLVAGANTIALELVPPLRNRLVGLASGGDPAYGQLAGQEGTLVAAGVVGPVVLACDQPSCF